MFCIFLVACFFVSSVCRDAIAVAAIPTVDTAQYQQIFNDFILPYNYGKITKSHFAGTDRVVINIQDLHCHPQVQRNISNIIELFDTKYGVTNIYLEGAYGDVSTKWLTENIQNKDKKIEILNKILETGKLTGAEYYSAISNKTELIKGLEKKEPYIENLKRFGDLIEKQPEIQVILKGIEESTAKVKKQYYTKKQYKLEEWEQKYNFGKIKPEKYYSLISKYTRNAGISLSKYKNISLYLELLKLQKKLKHKTLREELQSFILTLKQKLPYETYRMLLFETNNFKKIDRLYLYTIKNNIKTDNDWPELNKYFNYMKLNQQINPLELIKEREHLMSEINSEFLDTIAQREVIFLTHFEKYLKEYLSTKITPDDYEYYKENIERYKKLYNKYVDNKVLSLLKPYMEEIDKFYEINIARNDYFAENLFSNTEIMRDRVIDGRIEGNGEQRQKAENIQEKSEINKIIENMENVKRVDVIVTGGFHSQSVTEILENKGVSYIVITPNVKNGIKEAEKTYYQIAKEQKEFNFQTIATLILSDMPIEVVIKTLLESGVKKEIIINMVKDKNLVEEVLKTSAKEIEDNYHVSINSLKNRMKNALNLECDAVDINVLEQITKILLSSIYSKNYEQKDVGVIEEGMINALNNREEAKNFLNIFNILNSDAKRKNKLQNVQDAANIIATNKYLRKFIKQAEHEMPNGLKLGYKNNDIYYINEKGDEIYLKEFEQAKGLQTLQDKKTEIKKLENEIIDLVWEYRYKDSYKVGSLEAIENIKNNMAPKLISFINEMEESEDFKILLLNIYIESIKITKSGKKNNLFGENKDNLKTLVKKIYNSVVDDYDEISIKISEEEYIKILKFLTKHYDKLSSPQRKDVSLKLASYLERIIDDKEIENILDDVITNFEKSKTDEFVKIEFLMSIIENVKIENILKYVAFFDEKNDKAIVRYFEFYDSSVGGTQIPDNKFFTMKDNGKVLRAKQELLAEIYNDLAPEQRKEMFTKNGITLEVDKMFGLNDNDKDLFEIKTFDNLANLFKCGLLDGTIKSNANIKEFFRKEMEDDDMDRSDPYYERNLEKAKKTNINGANEIKVLFENFYKDKSKYEDINNIFIKFTGRTIEQINKNLKEPVSISGYGYKKGELVQVYADEILFSILTLMKNKYENSYKIYFQVLKNKNIKTKNYNFESSLLKDGPARMTLAQAFNAGYLTGDCTGRAAAYFNNINFRNNRLHLENFYVIGYFQDGKLIQKTMIHYDEKNMHICSLEDIPGFRPNNANTEKNFFEEIAKYNDYVIMIKQKDRKGYRRLTKEDYLPAIDDNQIFAIKKGFVEDNKDLSDKLKEPISFMQWRDKEKKFPMEKLWEYKNIDFEGVYFEETLKYILEYAAEESIENVYLETDSSNSEYLKSFAKNITREEFSENNNLYVQAKLKTMNKINWHKTKEGKIEINLDKNDENNYIDVDKLIESAKFNARKVKVLRLLTGHVYSFSVEKKFYVENEILNNGVTEKGLNDIDQNFRVDAYLPIENDGTIILKGKVLDNFIDNIGEVSEFFNIPAYALTDDKDKNDFALQIEKNKFLKIKIEENSNVYVAKKFEYIGFENGIIPEISNEKTKKYYDEQEQKEIKEKIAAYLPNQINHFKKEFINRNLYSEDEILKMLKREQIIKVDDLKIIDVDKNFVTVGMEKSNKTLKFKCVVNKQLKQKLNVSLENGEQIDSGNDRKINNVNEKIQNIKAQGFALKEELDKLKNKIAFVKIKLPTMNDQDRMNAYLYQKVISENMDEESESEELSAYKFIKLLKNYFFKSQNKGNINNLKDVLIQKSEYVVDEKIVDELLKNDENKILALQNLIIIYDEIYDIEDKEIFTEKIVEKNKQSSHPLRFSKINILLYDQDIEDNIYDFYMWLEHYNDDNYEENKKTEKNENMKWIVMRAPETSRGQKNLIIKQEENSKAAIRVRYDSENNELVVYSADGIDLTRSEIRKLLEKAFSEGRKDDICLVFNNDTVVAVENLMQQTIISVDDIKNLLTSA